MKKEKRIWRSDAKQKDLGKLEARDVAGYEAQPQTVDEIRLWLNEQVWPEARFGEVSREEP